MQADKKALVAELYSRRDGFSPEKLALVTELASRYGISDGPAPTPESPGLLERAGGFIAREGPKMAGAGLGAAVGAPAGPAGMLMGASAGAAGGEALRQGFEQLRGTEQLDPGRIQRAYVEGPVQEAGGALAAKLPGAVSKALLKSPLGAERQMQRVLSPTTKQNKFLAQKVAPEMVDKKVMALTRGQLQVKALKFKRIAGREVDKAWLKLPPGEKMSAKAVADALEKAKGQFVVDGVSVVPAATDKLDELAGIIKSLGDEVSPQSLRKVRQVWDMIVNKSGGFGGKDLGSTSQVFAQKQAADAIRREIGKKYPDIAKLNAEFNFWSNVDDLLSAAIQRDMNKSLTLTDLVTGTGGLGIAVRGTGLLTSLAPVMPLLIRAVQSTAWRTTSAATKSIIADRIRKGEVEVLARMLGRISGERIVMEKAH